MVEGDGWRLSDGLGVQQRSSPMPRHTGRPRRRRPVMMRKASEEEVERAVSGASKMVGGRKEGE